MNATIFFLVGGIIIGIAASLLMLGYGRVMGASGIVFGAFSAPSKDQKMWRWLFLLGMIAGGFFLAQWNERFFDQSDIPAWRIIIAGLLVGFGTRMGSGCTSGHGICGISRLSLRSLIATCIFVVVALVTYTLSTYIL